MSTNTKVRVIGFIAAALLIFLSQNVIGLVIGVGIMIGLLVSLELEDCKDDHHDKSQ